MSRFSALLLLAGLALVAMFVSLPASGSVSSDCTTYTPTPTVMPTPTPTPVWEPYARVAICNDTGQVVSDLHVSLVRPADNPDPIGANAPGCPQPAYSYGDSSTSYTSISIDWGTPCVHPGEMVALYFFAGCGTPQPGCSPPDASCFYWTLDGAPVPVASPAPNPIQCASPSPVPTGTPQPTGPCPARGTPPVTLAPTPTPATATPTPGPTSRDVVITTTIPFCNDAGQSASDLHVHFAFPYSGRTFKANPSGCPEPSFEPVQYGLDTFDLEVDWGVACVDPGESLTLEFVYGCGDVPCYTPQPFCYTWTSFGEPLYQGPGDCQLPTLTPTPTPSASPVSTPRPSVFAKGDVDCSTTVAAVDALKVLRYVAGLPVQQSEPCQDIGTGAPYSQGDADCYGGVTAVDALKTLRYVAGLQNSLPGGCPAIGVTPTPTPNDTPAPT